MSTPEASSGSGGPPQGASRPATGADRAVRTGATPDRGPRTASVSPSPRPRAARVEVQQPTRPRPAPAPGPAAGPRPAPAAQPAPGPQPAPGAAAPSTSGDRPLPSARVRRARLVLSRVDPWSVMKLSFVLSVALGIIFLTAVAVLWIVLDGMGIFSSLDRTAGELTRGETGGGLDLDSALGLGRILRLAGLLAAVNVLLLTALSTLGAFLYNLASSLVGGLHLTLSEES